MRDGMSVVRYEHCVGVGVVLRVVLPGLRDPTDWQPVDGPTGSCGHRLQLVIAGLGVGGVRGPPAGDGEDVEWHVNEDDKTGEEAERPAPRGPGLVVKRSVEH